MSHSPAVITQKLSLTEPRAEFVVEGKVCYLFWVKLLISV